jgi:hypothetical protein
VQLIRPLTTFRIIAATATTHTDRPLPRALRLPYPGGDTDQELDGTFAVSDRLEVTYMQNPYRASGVKSSGRSRRIVPTSSAKQRVTGTRSAKCAEFQFIFVRRRTALNKP